MVYLDFNASTPVDQRVLTGVIEALDQFGNPSSAHHRQGQVAAELIEGARNQIASMLGRPSLDVLLTSGATESAALGIVGAMLGAPDRPNVVVAATEHKAIIAAAELGARLSGGELRLARVDRSGLIDLDQLARLVDDSVAVVAVMAANNETGVIGPVGDVHELAQKVGAFNFVDITQLVGKGSSSDVVPATDIAVCSSHKIYGPKGAGALIASRDIQRRLLPLIPGGGQERGLRGGTHNTPAIVGFGIAADLVKRQVAEDTERMKFLSSRLLDSLRNGLTDVQINGEGAELLPNTLNIRFAGADAEAVMASMPQLSVSAGSACQAASSRPSHVLLAMGCTRVEAEESLRFSLGRPTSIDDIDEAAAAIISAVSRVRKLSAA